MKKILQKRRKIKITKQEKIFNDIFLVNLFLTLLFLCFIFFPPIFRSFFPPNFRSLDDVYFSVRSGKI